MNNDFIKSHILIVKPAPVRFVTKYYKYACNNTQNIISSVYVYEKSTDKPLRKYEYFSDSKIYCTNLLNQEITKTDLSDLEKPYKLLIYDNENYGGFFQ